MLDNYPDGIDHRTAPWNQPDAPEPTEVECDCCDHEEAAEDVCSGTPCTYGDGCPGTMLAVEPESCYWCGTYGCTHPDH